MVTAESAHKHNLVVCIYGGLALQQRQDRLDVAVLSRPVQRRLAVLRGE